MTILAVISDYALVPVEPTFAFSPSYKSIIRNCHDIDIYHDQDIVATPHPTLSAASSPVVSSLPTA